MSTFKKQFKHLKEKDPIAYHELKGNPCGADSNTTVDTVLTVCLVIILALSIFGLILLLT
jgi:hypothetical protein